MILVNHHRQRTRDCVKFAYYISGGGPLVRTTLANEHGSVSGSRGCALTGCDRQVR